MKKLILLGFAVSILLIPIATAQLTIWDDNDIFWDNLDDFWFWLDILLRRGNWTMQNLNLSGVTSCSEALETDANGRIICGTDETGAGLAYDLNITNGTVSEVITDSETLTIQGGTGIIAQLVGNIFTIVNTIIDTVWNINTNHFINNSGTLELNWTTINDTIDARENDTWNTTTEMRTAVNNSGYYNISINHSNVLNHPADIDTDTWNTTEEMQDAVGSAFNDTLIYSDTNNEMGFNQTWGNNAYINEGDESDPLWSGNQSSYYNKTYVYNKTEVDDSIGSDHPHQDVQTTASPEFNGLTSTGQIALNSVGANYLTATNVGGDLRLGAGGGTNDLKIDTNGNIDIYENLDVGGTFTDGTLTITGGDLTTSGRIITTGGGETGRFLTGNAGRTVFAFSGGDFDIRAGDGTSSSQNVMRVDNSGDFDFYDGNLTTTGTLSASGATITGTLDAGTFQSLGNFYINYDGGEGDSNIYFYEGGLPYGAYLRWDDSETAFALSHGISLGTGDLTTSGTVTAEQITSTDDISVTGQINTNEIYGGGGNIDANIYTPSNTQRFYVRNTYTDKYMNLDVDGNIYMDPAMAIDGVDVSEHNHSAGQGGTIDHADITAGTGADHTYIDQSVITLASPTFAGLEIDGAGSNYIDIRSASGTYDTAVRFYDQVTGLGYIGIDDSTSGDPLFIGTGATIGSNAGIKMTSTAMTFSKDITCADSFTMSKSRFILAGATFANLDTTPDVSKANVFTVTNTFATTITDFDGGATNQVIIIIAGNSNTVIDDGLNIHLSGTVDFAMRVGDTLTLVSSGGVWIETARMER